MGYRSRENPFNFAMETDESPRVIQGIMRGCCADRPWRVEGGALQSVVADFPLIFCFKLYEPSARPVALSTDSVAIFTIGELNDKRDL